MSDILPCFKTATVKTNPSNLLPSFSSGFVREDVGLKKARRIIVAVSQVFDVTIENIMGRRRDSQTALARQVSMQLIRRCTNLSYSSIATLFNKDHGTVMYACGKVADFRSYMKSLDITVSQMEVSFGRREEKTEVPTLIGDPATQLDPHI